MISQKKNRNKTICDNRDNLHLAKKTTSMKKIIVFFLGLTFCATFLFAQDIERNVKERLTDYFNQYTATAKSALLN